jgi:hypothetical protein
VFLHFLYGISIRGNALSEAAEGSSPTELQRRIDEVASDPDIRMYADLYRTLVNPNRVPSFLDVLLNPLAGPFYREHSAAFRNHTVSVPAYLSSGWWAYAHMHLRGAFQNFAQLQGPKRLLIGPPVITECPLPRSYHEEALRWYDHWLKGADNGLLDEPPIKIFVMGINSWRTENEWPLARTRWTKLYLHPGEQLLEDADVPAGEPDVFVQEPPIHTASIATVRYRTPPLSEPIEVTGPIALYLHAAIDQEDTNWIISLRDLAPDGSVHELTKGFLKSSHRKLDQHESKPWLPYHPHTEREPVAPSRRVRHRALTHIQRLPAEPPHRARDRQHGSSDDPSPHHNGALRPCQAGCMAPAVPRVQQQDD